MSFASLAMFYMISQNRLHSLARGCTGRSRAEGRKASPASEESSQLSEPAKTPETVLTPIKKRRTKTFHKPVAMVEDQISLSCYKLLELHMTNASVLDQMDVLEYLAKCSGPRR